VAQNSMFATAADAQHQLGQHLMARMPCGSLSSDAACLAGRIRELCAHGSTSGRGQEGVEPHLLRPLGHCAVT
jgi:hypothetical protein